VQANQERWVDLVERSLRAFIPWSTLETCPVSGGISFDAKTSFLAKESRHISQDSLELRRCHVFIDPDCYERLIERTGLGSPRERLTIPQFLNANTSDHGDGYDKFGQDLQDLTDAEASKIMTRVDEESVLRQQISPRVVRILANGEECARIDLTASVASYECEISEGTSLLEIATEFNGRTVPLATHWIEYTRCDGVVPVRTTLRLGHGSELSIQIARVEETEERPRGILLRLKAGRRRSWAGFGEPFNLSAPWFYGTAGVALTAVLLIAIGRIGSLRSRQEIEMLRAEVAAEKSARLAAENQRPSALSEHAPYQLVPDDFSQRGAESAANEAPIVVLPHQEIVTLDLPVKAGHLSHRAVLKTYLDGKEILSEGSLFPRKDHDESVIEFVIPVAVLGNGQMYTVELYSMNDTERHNKIHSFTFSTVKK
jgi:hypothetical protein